jgi:hypothetical protein
MLACLVVMARGRAMQLHRVVFMLAGSSAWWVVALLVGTHPLALHPCMHTRLHTHACMQGHTMALAFKGPGPSSGSPTT